MRLLRAQARHRSELIELLDAPPLWRPAFSPPTNQVVISSASSSAAPQSRLLWRRATEDLHVATIDGEFAGFVTVSGSLHTLHGPYAQPLGTYRSLDAASAVLDLECSLADTAPEPLNTP
jgi:hypothetical protein